MITKFVCECGKVVAEFHGMITVDGIELDGVMDMTVHKGATSAGPAGGSIDEPKETITEEVIVDDTVEEGTDEPEAVPDEGEPEGTAGQDEVESAQQDAAEESEPIRIEVPEQFCYLENGHIFLKFDDAAAADRLINLILDRVVPHE